MEVERVKQCDGLSAPAGHVDAASLSGFRVADTHHLAVWHDLRRIRRTEGFQVKPPGHFQITEIPNCVRIQPAQREMGKAK